MKRRDGNEYPIITLVIQIQRKSTSYLCFHPSQFLSFFVGFDPKFYVSNLHENKQFQRTLPFGKIGPAAVEPGEPGILSPDLSLSLFSGSFGGGRKYLPR